MDNTCYLCGRRVPEGEGTRHDVLDSNGFGQLNALIGTCCAFDDDEFEPDTDDDFPMSLEYDGLWGAPDYLIEQSAQEEAGLEREVLGDE